MALRPLNRRMIGMSPKQDVCTVLIDTDQSQIVFIRVRRSCSVMRKLRADIQQGAAKTFLLTDSTDVDFTGVTEFTFTLWAGNISGAQLLQKTYTSGDIVFTADNVASMQITSAESLALAAGSHWFEVAVTASDGRKLSGGGGRFRVYDRRSFDT